jgi:magnesium chelatase family protein
VNSQVPGPWLRGAPARLAIASTAGLDRALERGGITMRGYDRVLRIAWTLADYDGLSSPGPDQVGQALYLRKGMTS